MTDILWIVKIVLLCLEVLLSLICVILCICRKTKLEIKDTNFERLLSKLPYLIQQAELYFKEGSLKKSFVLSVSLSFLADLIGKPVSEIAPEYSDRISAAIENILETPQKKEVIVNGND